MSSSPDLGTDARAGMLDASAAMCVLASGSSGNCTVLAIGPERPRRLVLIDLGLSPRRIRELLRVIGAEFTDVGDVLLTHLDSDHLHPAWRQRGLGLRGLLEHAKLRIHRRHAETACDLGLDWRRLSAFDSAFDLSDDVAVSPRLFSHDDLGVVAFRFETPDVSVGFATDLGRVTDELIDHLLAVDLLAIESNYCPRMQVASKRPDFLKQRIMGGAGHLSNQQCAQAVAAIKPRERVVLLHLSRQCNLPELAQEAHAGAPYTLTVSRHDRPTGWLGVRGGARPGVQVRTRTPAGLFSALAG